MRFKVGDVYEQHDGRTAIVTEIRDDGRSGRLRFTDTRTEEWFVYQELLKAGNWRQRV